MDIDMNSPEMQKVIREVFDELIAMPHDEFVEEFEKHKRGQIYHILMDSGAILLPLINLVDPETREKLKVELTSMAQVESYIEASRAGRECGELFKEMFGKNSEDINN